MKDELISTTSFAKATHLERFKLGADLLLSISKIKEVNELYKNASKHKEAFIASIFEQLSISIDFEEKELKRIPKSGPFITISNHPFGALDGLVLIFLLTKIRSDFKVIANFLLQQIKPIEDYFIPVNPFESDKIIYSSISGTRTSLKWLQDGHGLGIFPAGEVSSFQKSDFKITDKEWSHSILKLIHKAKVPIIPIYFKGNNSLTFHLLGVIHPSFRTIALPSELVKKKDSRIKVRIGNVVTNDDLIGWKNAKEFGRFLRAKTYSLDSKIESLSYFRQITPAKKPATIAPPDSLALVIKEISKIENYKIHAQGDFNLYLAPAKEIPTILKEIGRLREITFREVGEGTNKPTDLDEFVLYYHHLFLWDKPNLKIVGAYRLGLGQEVYNAFGKNGFYLSSLFKFNKAFHPILQQSIEMGRSFVVKEYQQKRLPLFLLWQGIINFILEHENYHYLVGPVSISNNYSKLSKKLIVAFIRKYYFDTSLAGLIKPKKPFKMKFKNFDSEPLLKSVGDDLKKFDKTIADIEPTHAPVPVLIKKYLKQNAKIIGFNLDPKFNNCIDGFMILDIAKLPKDSIALYKKELIQKTDH
ncbi:MAG: lysophospholipid acyltransferase family protein [Vicingaceae bacterium]